MSSNPQELGLLPFSFANKHRILVTGIVDNRVEVVCETGVALDAIAEVRRHYGVSLALKASDSDEFEALLSATYQASSQGGTALMENISDEVDLSRLAEALPEAEDLLESEDDAPIIKLLNALFAEAIKQGASDIHIETFERRLSIRLRVDGVMREVLSPNRKLAAYLISRIKVMAKLDIAEKRVPQDGRVALKIAGRAIDIRVSTLPSNHGERVVMRLLDKQAARFDLPQLGMPPATLEQFCQLLRQPNGILLVTGPTGSGKTTTLYAGLNLLNDRERNILTVEDPIEYALEGIGQTQVNPRVDMTFARGLRAILRQDPDVVMVGEIRDQETATVAVQASLTGHLVLSTLHTNDAIGAITRLMDIGIEPYLIASSLKGVLAQRLIRRLCPECRTPATLSRADAQLLGSPELQGRPVYHAAGCEACGHTGYRGRQGIYELLVVDRPLAGLIHDRTGEAALRRQVLQRMTTMAEEGRRLVLEGVTTPEEVLRGVREEVVDAGL